MSISKKGMTVKTEDLADSMTGDFCLFNNNFLRNCLQQEKDMLPEMLRIFWENWHLRLKEYEVGKIIRASDGSTLTADAFAIDEEGAQYLMVVRRGGQLEEIAHHMSFMGSVLFTEAYEQASQVKKVTELSQIPLQHVLFISDQDFLGKKLQKYDVERVIFGPDGERLDVEPLDDRIRMRLVNGALHDETIMGSLVADMQESELARIKNAVLKT